MEGLLTTLVWIFVIGLFVVKQVRGRQRQGSSGEGGSRPATPVVSREKQDGRAGDESPPAGAAPVNLRDSLSGLFEEMGVVIDRPAPASPETHQGRPGSIKARPPSGPRVKKKTTPLRALTEKAGGRRPPFEPTRAPIKPAAPSKASDGNIAGQRDRREIGAEMDFAHASRDELRRAVVWAEILERPPALRDDN